MTAQQPDQIAASPDPVLSALQALVARVEDFTGRLDAIEKKVAAHAQAVPRYRPMQHEGIVNKPDLTLLKKKGDSVSRSQTLPHDSEGNTVQHYAPRFQEDQWVRIKADSEVGRLLAAPKKGRAFDLSTEGTVLGLHFISAHDGRAKYRVHFPGLTRPRGDGFWEDELEAA